MRRFDVVDEVLNRDMHDIKEGDRIDPHPKNDDHQWCKEQPFTRAQIEDRFEVFLCQGPKDNPAIEIKRIGRTEDQTGCRKECDPGIGLKRTKQGQDFTNETTRLLIALREPL